MTSSKSVAALALPGSPTRMNPPPFQKIGSCGTLLDQKSPRSRTSCSASTSPKKESMLSKDITLFAPPSNWNSGKEDEDEISPSQEACNSFVFI
jgi:hypothetical protein